MKAGIYARVGEALLRGTVALPLFVVENVGSADGGERKLAAPVPPSPLPLSLAGRRRCENL